MQTPTLEVQHPKASSLAHKLTCLLMNVFFVKESPNFCNFQVFYKFSRSYFVRFCNGRTVKVRCVMCVGVRSGSEDVGVRLVAVLSGCPQFRSPSCPSGSFFLPPSLLRSDLGAIVQIPLKTFDIFPGRIAFLCADRAGSIVRLSWRCTFG